MPTSLMCVHLYITKKEKEKEEKCIVKKILHTHIHTSNTKTMSICTQTCSNVVIRYAEIKQNEMKTHKQRQIVIECINVEINFWFLFFSSNYQCNLRVIQNFFNFLLHSFYRHCLLDKQMKLFRLTFFNKLKIIYTHTDKMNVFIYEK